MADESEAAQMVPNEVEDTMNEAVEVKENTTEDVEVCADAETQSGETTQKALKLVITGAPACGKGTQCARFISKYDLVHISTGDILRSAVAAGSDIGLSVKSHMENGELVPDDLIVQLVKDRLNQDDVRSRGFLLDGFPRTVAQATALIEADVGISAVVLIDLDDEIVVERATGRRLDPETGDIYHLVNKPPQSEEVAARLVQRSDDTEETVRARLVTYHQNIDVILEKFGSKVVRVAGQHSPDDIFSATVDALEKVGVVSAAVAAEVAAESPSQNEPTGEQPSQEDKDVESKQEAETDAASESETQQAVESASNEQTEDKAEPAAETETEPAAETETEPAAETETEPAAEAETEPEEQAEETAPVEVKDDGQVEDAVIATEENIEEPSAADDGCKEGEASAETVASAAQPTQAEEAKAESSADQKESESAEEAQTDDATPAEAPVPTSEAANASESVEESVATTAAAADETPKDAPEADKEEGKKPNEAADQKENDENELKDDEQDEKHLAGSKRPSISQTPSSTAAGDDTSSAKRRKSNSELAPGTVEKIQEAKTEAETSNAAHARAKSEPQAAPAPAPAAAAAKPVAGKNIAALQGKLGAGFMPMGMAPGTSPRAAKKAEEPDRSKPLDMQAVLDKPAVQKRRPPNLQAKAEKASEKHGEISTEVIAAIDGSTAVAESKSSTTVAESKSSKPSAKEAATAPSAAAEKKKKCIIS